MNYAVSDPTPWNKNKIVGQKLPLKLPEIWAIKTRLELGKKYRNTNNDTHHNNSLNPLSDVFLPRNLENTNGEI